MNSIYGSFWNRSRGPCETDRVGASQTHQTRWCVNSYFRFGLALLVLYSRTIQGDDNVICTT